MDIEEEIARALRDFLQPEGFEVAESDRIFAARVVPLVKRAQAEAWDEGARWAAVECGAIHDDRQAWIAPGDNPYTKGEQ